MTTSNSSRPRAAKRASSRKTSTRSKKASAAATSAASSASTAPSPLLAVVTAALEDMKAVNIKVMDVRGITDITDTMIVASGTSDRHVRSIADRIVQKSKEAGFRPHGVEGGRDSEWVLVDLSDVIVHIMLPRVREFYALEYLWDLDNAAGTGATAR